MYPEICRIGSFTVYSYGLMLVVAFAVGCALLISQAKRQNINSDIIFNLAFIAFVSGIAGARTFYVIENFPYYIKNLPEIIMLWRGGLSWFGGLVSGAVFGILYLKNKKLPIYKILDLAVPFVALAQAIGRIGCFLNGCCFGKESQSGIYFVTHKSVLIPIQLYSSLVLILIFIFLRFLQDRPHREGQIFFAYLLLYPLKRFFIEFWRADNPVIFSGLTLFQIISIAIFFLSLIKLILIKADKASR